MINIFDKAQIFTEGDSVGYSFKTNNSEIEIQLESSQRSDYFLNIDGRIFKYQLTESSHIQLIFICQKYFAVYSKTVPKILKVFKV